MRARVLFILAILCSLPAFAQTAAIQGFCNLGGAQASTSGLKSTNYQQGIIPSCTVTVYLTGTTTKATIYADGSNTPLSNPFTAAAVGSVAPGQWVFWAAVNQGYDVVMSGGIAPNTYPQPVTLTDVFPSTQFVSPGGGCTTDCVVTDPTGSQTITQPVGTTLLIDGQLTAPLLTVPPVTVGSLVPASSVSIGTMKMVDDIANTSYGLCVGGGAGYGFAISDTHNWHCNDAAGGPFLPLTGGTLTGALTAPSATTDVFRSGSRWFDIRSKGAKCDAVTNDTSAFISSLASITNSELQLPAGTCMVNPGPSTGAGSLLITSAHQWGDIAGRNGTHGTIIQDLGVNASSAPMLTIGDGTGIGAGADLSNLNLMSPTNGTTVTYPSGMLYLDDWNLQTFRNVTLTQHDSAGSPGNNSVGIYANSALGTSFFSEEKCFVCSVYGPGYGLDTIGIDIISPSGNIDFYGSNVEDWQTGVKVVGYGGTPAFNWFGGHLEQIGNGSRTSVFGSFAFDLDQVTPTIVGANVQSGLVFLGSSVVGGEISIIQNAHGWTNGFVDDGIGNVFHNSADTATASNGTEIDTDGEEWYRTLNQLVADPRFIKSGVTGWTVSGATVNTSETKAPRAPAGRSLYLTSTSANSYTQSPSVTVTPNTDYILTAVVGLSYSSPMVQLQVYDQTSTLLWDSGQTTCAYSPTIAGRSDSICTRVFHQILHVGASSTALNLRLVDPQASGSLSLEDWSITPSTMLSSTASPLGSASCASGTNTYGCTIPGRNNGSTSTSVSWTLTAPSYQTPAFLIFSANVPDGAKSAFCGWGSDATGSLSRIWLPMNTNRLYVIPINAVPQYITCQSYYDPTSSIITISDMAVVPYGVGVGIQYTTTPNDGKLVTGITPDGVEQRTNALAPTSVALSGGRAFTRHTILTTSATPVAVAANTCAAQTITVSGLNAGDHVINNDIAPNFVAGLSLNGVQITGANTAVMNWCNNTAAAITPPSGTYTFDVEQ